MASRLRRILAFIGNARARHLLVACGLLMGLVLAVTATLVLCDLRHRDIAEAGRELKNLAFIVAERIGQNLDDVKSVQPELSEYLRDPATVSADTLRLVGGTLPIFADLETAGRETRSFRIVLPNESSIALYRTDGMLTAHYPAVDPRTGQVYDTAADMPRLQDAMDRGYVATDFDGRNRLVAPHRVGTYPLILMAAATMESVLADWHERLLMFGGGALLLELVLAATVVLGWRHLRHHEELEATEFSLAIATERARGAQALQMQTARFDTALNNMLQGLLMFDRAGQLLVVNRRFCRMFGVPDGALTPGLPYREVTERIVQLGQVGADDMQGVRERRAELIARGEGATVTWETSSGRAFTVTHRPMEDGWLATFEEISAQRDANARMTHQAHHDALTDLPNRVLFREKLEAALAHVRRGDGMALLCLDLDQFKAVNDTLGHPVGDALLRAVAERLLCYTRDTDTVARLGGDEFAIIQASIEKPTQASGFADRLLALFEPPFDVAGHQIVIGTSIGIAFAPQDAVDGDALLKNADLALYRAKTDGRGIYRLFHAEMDAQMQARRLLEIDLRQAQRAGQFELFYQPLVNMGARRVTGFEALLRWRHPRRGLVSPAHFIPLTEELGLIVPIGDWVLRQACAAAAAWPGDQRVAVNLSPAQFRHRCLVATVEQALRESGLPPDRLELEITETVMLQDTEATLATLHELHALGVCIAMDDFGTGYSSFSYLRRFAFDRIKIDQSFVRDLCARRDSAAIVCAVAGLSQELGMATTAEGVETREQLELLTSAGCTEVQGYLFSPAVPIEAVADLQRSIAALLRKPLNAGVSEPFE